METVKGVRIYALEAKDCITFWAIPRKIRKVLKEFVVLRRGSFPPDLWNSHIHGFSNGGKCEICNLFSAVLSDWRDRRAAF